ITNNKLANLDLSANQKLTQLYCSMNRLTTLNVGTNVLLEELFCFDNLLSTLDLTKNVTLKQLYCYENMLTSLDLKNGNNSMLTFVNAEQNENLTCIQVDNANSANLGHTPYLLWVVDDIVNYSEDCNYTN
ncbi:MAG: hypothetical protein WBF67_04035, partial [Olleya sp.]